MGAGTPPRVSPHSLPPELARGEQVPPPPRSLDGSRTSHCFCKHTPSDAHEQVRFGPSGSLSAIVAQTRCVPGYAFQQRPEACARGSFTLRSYPEIKPNHGAGRHRSFRSVVALMPTHAALLHRAEPLRSFRAVPSDTARSPAVVQAPATPLPDPPLLRHPEAPTRCHALAEGTRACTTGPGVRGEKPLAAARSWGPSQALPLPPTQTPVLGLLPSTSPHPQTGDRPLSCPGRKDAGDRPASSGSPRCTSPSVSGTHWL